MDWEPTKEEIKYLIGFHTIAGLGPATIAKLLVKFGSFRQAWSAAQKDLILAGLSPKLASLVIDQNQQSAETRLVKRLQALGIDWVVKGQQAYPSQLHRLGHPPWVLFYQGKLVDRPMLAVVGTRHPTKYGEQVAVELVGDLINCGYLIVSGLARGIDRVAHQAAVENHGRTLAVLAGGLDKIYPRSSDDLAKRIIRSGGGLLSEYPPETAPARTNFIARNRIMAGLSLGVIVVEAGHRSGAKNTAWWAKRFQIPVMAIPGPVTADQSAGCHDLIKNGARLVTSVGDILDEINQTR